MRTSKNIIRGETVAQYLREHQGTSLEKTQVPIQMRTSKNIVERKQWPNTYENIREHNEKIHSGALRIGS